MGAGLVLSLGIAAGQIDAGTKKFGDGFGLSVLAMTLDKVGAGNMHLNSMRGVKASDLENSLEQKLPPATWNSLGVRAKLIWWSPAFGFGLSLVFLLGIGRLMSRSNKNEKFIRGGELVPAKQLAKTTYKLPAGFALGGVPIPASLEPMHLLISGSTGSLKTLTFLHVLDAARCNKQRVILADSGGEFLQRYFRGDDVILNPFDARGADWSPFAEMRGLWDAERIAKSIIPDGRGSETEWNGYAQQILAAVLQRLWETGKPTNGELSRILCIAGSSELKDLVAGLPASRMFEEGGERFLASVLAIIGSYAKPLTWLDPSVGQNGFSIRAWLEQGSDGWIYLTYRDDQLASLRPLIAAQIDMLTAGILSLPANPNRRVWLALDEFASLGKVQSIEQFLSKARKYGGCGVLGLQVLSQLQETYGDKMANTILGGLGTWVVGQQPETETREYLSKYFGRPEVLRELESGSKGGDGAGTVSQQYGNKTIIESHEIRDLPPKHGFLKIKGGFPPCRIVLGDLPKVNSGHDAFIPKDLTSRAQPAQPKSFGFEA